MNATHTATTTALITLLAGLAEATEVTVLDAACMVHTFKVRGAEGDLQTVDLVISRRAGRLIRAHFLAPRTAWYHFTGGQRALATQVRAALELAA